MGGQSHVDSVDRFLDTAVGDVVGIAQAGDPRAVTPHLGLLVRLAQAQPAPAQAAPAQGGDGCETVPLDWEDPLYDTTWTGTVTQCPTSLAAHAEGRGEGTLVKVDLSVEYTLGGATAELKVKGTAPQQVTYWDVPTQSDKQTMGRVKVDATATVEMGPGALLGATMTLRERASYEEQIERSGTWETVHRGSATIDADVQTDGQQELSIEGTFDFTEAEKVGEGFLETRSQGTFEASGQATEDGWESYLTVTDARGGNSMRGYFQVLRSGQATGWVRDAQGRELASISGSLQDGIEVCAEGRGCKTVWPGVAATAAPTQSAR